MVRTMPDRNMTVKNVYSAWFMEPIDQIVQTAAMDNLASIREARGLTQEDLSDLTGFSQSYISKIEAGKANPSLDTILKIAKALKAEPSELFTISSLKQRALTALAAIDEPGRQEAALVVLEAMAANRRPED